MTTIYQTGTEITTHISYHKRSVGGEADNKITQCFALWWHKLKISIYFTSTHFSFKPRAQIINSSGVLCATESPQKVKRLICTLPKTSSSMHSEQSKPALLVMAVPTPNNAPNPTSRAPSAPLWAKQNFGTKISYPSLETGSGHKQLPLQHTETQAMIVKRLLGIYVPGFYCPTKPHTLAPKPTRITLENNW